MSEENRDRMAAALELFEQVKQEKIASGKYSNRKHAPWAYTGNEDRDWLTDQVPADWEWVIAWHKDEAVIHRYSGGAAVLRAHIQNETMARRDTDEVQRLLNGNVPAPRQREHIDFSSVPSVRNIGKDFKTKRCDRCGKKCENQKLTLCNDCDAWLEAECATEPETTRATLIAAEYAAHDGFLAEFEAANRIDSIAAGCNALGQFLRWCGNPGRLAESDRKRKDQ